MQYNHKNPQNRVSHWPVNKTHSQLASPKMIHNLFPFPNSFWVSFTPRAPAHRPSLSILPSTSAISSKLLFDHIIPALLFPLRALCSIIIKTVVSIFT